MAKALWQHVREKAILANSTIVYMQNGKMIEENPGNTTKKVISKI